MKKYSIIIFFLFISVGAQSQVLIALLLGDKLNTGKIEFGLDGGLNYSTIGGLETSKYANSFNLGFYFDIKMKNQWYLNTGVLVKSTLGAEGLTETDLTSINATIFTPDNQDGEGSYTQKLNGFLVPVLAKYKFKNNFHIEAGPQFGWIYKSWVEYNYEIDGNSAKIKEYNRDETNWFDMGVAGGFGYRFLKGLGWTATVRYYYGFTNLYKNVSGSNNSSLFLKLNIPFGVSEEKKEEITEMKLHLKTKKEEKKAARKAAKENKN